MADFNIRSESVDVEQIMKQIRARIREKRGVDYTEDQVRELATVRLEKFLDPKNLRSDLLEQFKRSRPALPEPPKEPPPVEPPYAFDDNTLFASHRGGLRFIRKLLRPFLKLFFNPNTLNQVLHAQAQFNIDMLKRDQRRKIEMQTQIQAFDQSRAEWNMLYYEVLHNLVLETTRNGIELKNLRMRVEALASRLDFSERRVRALEGVVQYRPEAPRRSQHSEGRDRRPLSIDGQPAEELGEGAPAANAGEGNAPTGGGLPTPSEGRRRRRRRRGRRTGGPGGMAPGTAVNDEGVVNGEGLSDVDATSNDAFDSEESAGPDDDVDTDTVNDPEAQ
jgi:hypothetical protein